MSITSLYRNARTIVPDSKKNSTLAFAFIMAGTCLDNMNITGTMTSYFSITEKFGADSTTTTWVLSAYSLTLGAFIIISGKLADVFGPENVFIFGMLFTALFALISAVIEKSIIALIVFRALQGIAASTTIPSSFAYVGTFFHGKAQERALSLLILSLTGIFGIGLILGGAFSATSIGYKGVYYVTFAIAFLCAIFMLLLSPDVPRNDEQKIIGLKHLDYGGSLALVIGLLLIILGLTEGGSSWKKPSAYVPIPIGLVIVSLVILFETWYIQSYKNIINDQSSSRRSSNASEELKEESVETEKTVYAEDWRSKLELLFPAEAFKVPNMFQFLFGTAVAYITFIAAMATMVQYYLYVEQQSPIMTGVKTLPLVVGLCFGALVYRHDTAEKIGLKICCVLSAVIQLTMGVWLSRLDPTVKNSYWKYEFPSMLIFAYGTNLYYQIYWNAVMKGTPVQLLGVVSGMLQTAGQIGLCLGNAIITTVVGELVLNKDWEYRIALKHRFDNCFYMLFASTGLMILLMLSVRKVK